MHPDLPQEQAYFDRALALRDRQHAVLERAPNLSAHPKAVMELRRRVSGLGVVDPDEAVAFGRIDAGGQRWYIGKGAIWDDDNDLVVVNWQAPIAAPFYTASPHDPEGLDARRVYRCQGNQIQAIEEILFRDLAEAIAEGREPGPVVSDALLESLGFAAVATTMPDTPTASPKAAASHNHGLWRFRRAATFSSRLIVALPFCSAAIDLANSG